MSTSTEVSEATEALIKQLEADLEQITESIVSGYRFGIASYRDASPEVLNDARDGARASILVGASIMRGEVSGSTFTEPLRDVGRRRAEQGIPLHDVLLAYLIGSQIFWDTVFEIAPEDEAERLSILTTLTKASFDLLQHAVAAVSEGYLEVEAGRVADVEHENQALVETIAGLREPTARHAQRAEALGVDLQSLSWCIVAEAGRDSAGASARRLRADFPGAAIGRIGTMVVGFFSGAEAPRFDVGPAGSARCQKDPARAFRRARSALEVARHLGEARARYEDVVPLALVLSAPPEEREEFVKAQLGDLLADPLGEELISSLRSYYGHGHSVAAAARALFVHRHTLEYRLSRIEDLTGVDIREPGSRLLLELALSLKGEPGPRKKV